MMQLAIDTGGKSVAAHHASDLAKIYQQIAADVRNLYRVGYVPSPLVRDGAWHQIAGSRYWQRLSSFERALAIMRRVAIARHATVSCGCDPCLDSSEMQRDRDAEEEESRNIR